MKGHHNNVAVQGVGQIGQPCNDRSRTMTATELRQLPREQREAIIRQQVENVLPEYEVIDGNQDVVEF